LVFGFISKNPGKEDFMGLLDSLLGKKAKEHPPLDAESPAAKNIEGVKDELGEFVSETEDHIEVIPLEGEAYMFFGDPPKKFGVAWIKGGKQHNFKSLLNEAGVSEAALQKLAATLKEAYVQHEGEPRYNLDFGGKTVVVIPSPDLGREVQRIIAAVVK
jgi:hypothetical protein